MEGESMQAQPPSATLLTNETSANTPYHAFRPSFTMSERSQSNILGLESESSSSPFVTSASTPNTSTSSSQLDSEAASRNLGKYIALGCLHFHQPLPVNAFSSGLVPDWAELLFHALPDDVKLILGTETTRLLEANWIRLFLHCPEDSPRSGKPILRVYLLPEDWGRRFIDRRSKSLKAALRAILQDVDISPEAWCGDHDEAHIRHFDPWASAENVSLFYLFNKLPSPDPSPGRIKNRYTRDAIWSLLDSASQSSLDPSMMQPVAGLKTKLYPYQARSASLMVQREAAPQLQLDPRLEIRTSPTGDKFFFGARDGSFLQEPRYYETSRGGILAETMGLGKTIICLAVILATRGHMPQIPPTYQSPPQVRKQVGSLAHMAANLIGRHAIPGKAYLEQQEIAESIDLSRCKERLDQNIATYEIPAEVPRMNRTTRVPPPRQLVMCKGTILVVPKNLLHQWQAEIRKHISKDHLKVLVMDTKPKRTVKAKVLPNDEGLDLRSDLPSATELLTFDIILFTRNRFEQEIQDGSDEGGRRLAGGAPLACQCAYIGASRIRDCRCVSRTGIYESPLKMLHWLRIIIDEGHNFSSVSSNAVLVAKQLQAERRWVVSGTPAKNLVGVEVDISTLEGDSSDPILLRELAVEQRKAFSLDDDNTKAAKALGLLASNFLMVRPWSDSTAEGRLEWDDYVYRHEHHFRKTYSGFSACFLRTLEGLVVKTRPEDVERDIVLPPMKHQVVYLKPCWFDKMTANLFIQVLRANAITSERSDVDYLFHKNSIKPRHSLIKNLRQSNFTWTGFTLDDVASTLETSSKYLEKDEKKCSIEDANLLLESCRIVAELMRSEGWIALSKAHEVGIAVEDWPLESEESFALSFPEKPAMLGITQLIDGQAFVDSQILSNDPAEGLTAVGQAARARLVAMEQAETSVKRRQEKESLDGLSSNVGVPSSCVGGQPLTSRRISSIPAHSSPKKKSKYETIMSIKEENHSDVATSSAPDVAPTTPIKPKKRRLTLADETAELPVASSLRKARVIGTTSAKLTYLVEKVVSHQATEKIIIFYDGDNAAFYLAQCFEMLYINHRIYARTLDNTTRSQYVALFNEDPDLRVLMIDVACGALGLNLNAASIVLIVNPINRPGIEAQAIKRAHRIGQTKDVLVETLILEGTIEEDIYKRARNMSRNEHLEAKTLEDDDRIMDIIQNANVLPIEPDEWNGPAQFALLKTPQQIFGRPGREKYHRYGHLDAKSPDVPNKRPRNTKSNAASKKMKGAQGQHLNKPLALIAGSGQAQSEFRTDGSYNSSAISSIFGAGNPSLFGS